MLRMKWFRDNFLDKKNKYTVLDVGSYGVNGTYKEIFFGNNFTYTGLDIVDGPNVDLVPKNIYSWLEIPDNHFDIVISGQAFEHIEFFWLTMYEIARVLKKGGLICIIAPSNLKEHRYPVDCWRFFSDGMVSLARWTNLTVLHAHTNCAPSPYLHKWFSLNNADSILIAQKDYDGKPNFVTKDYKCEPLNSNQKHQDFIMSKQYYPRITSIFYVSITSTMNFIAKVSRYIARNLRQS